MKAVAIALCFATASYGQADGGYAFDYQCPPADDIVAVDGGYFMSEARAKRLACLLTAAETHRDGALKLLNEGGGGTGNVLVPIVGVAGIVLGFVLGLVFVKKK